MEQSSLEQKCRQCSEPISPKNAHTKCHYHPGTLRADLTVFRAHHYADIHQKEKRKVTNFILNNVENDGPWWFWTCCHQEGRLAHGCKIGEHLLETVAL